MRRYALFVSALLCASACKDPTLVDRANALGADPGPYPEGPNHYAGYPCTYCHAKGSTASSSVFDIAGTVYERADSGGAMRDVLVRLFDQKGREVTLQSNAAGNFFVAEGELTLEFPLWVKLEYQGETTAMQSPILRERSCAACHTQPANEKSAGRVFLWEDQ